MQRAQRAADSPLRAIIEASKVRRRIEPEPTGEAEAPARRPVLPRGAPAETVRAETRAAAPPLPVPGRNTAPPPAVAREDEAITVRTLQAQVPARTAAVDVAPLAPLSRGAAPVPTAADLPRVPSLPEAPAALPRAGPAAAPRLLHMVEPEIGPRLIEQLARPEVSVQFVIQPDGSVDAVQVLPPVPRQIVPLIVSAVEQWRFSPQPAPRPHRVQLVFKAD
ncbi:MAG: hypothetical protein JNL30_03675 [Rubrivivax sp.]|nr:hypothetical protein [Rubrivivax sp.]